MPNPLYQQMNANRLSQNKGNLQQFMQMMKSGGNPNQIMQMMVQQNPQAKEMLNTLNSSGMSAKQFFMQMARNKGIDPSSITNMLQ